MTLNVLVSVAVAFVVVIVLHALLSGDPQ